MALSSESVVDYPLLVKINSQDFLADGLTEEDFLTVAGWLEEHGVKAIEVSGGVLTSEKNLGPSRSGKLEPQQEAYFRETAAKVKLRVNLPVILVGGIRSPAVAEQLLAGQTADFFFNEPSADPGTRLSSALVERRYDWGQVYFVQLVVFDRCCCGRKYIARWTLKNGNGMIASAVLPQGLMPLELNFLLL